MAQTISELEKERAKLLEAIENQASQISAKRGSSSNEARPHTLNDWLNAAEHVMPSNEKPKPTQSMPNSVRPKQPQSKPPMNTASNKASFFGVIIMLSLLLTIIGVVYIAFTTAQKDMQNLMAVHDETLEKLNSVEQELAELKKTVEEGGDSEAFAEVTARLDRFEQEIDGLKHLQARVENQKQNTLDVAALDNVSRKLERQLNSRLEGLVQRLQTVGVSLETESSEPETTSNNEPTIQEPSAPTEPVAPKIEQKVVKLVESKSTADVDWLKQQKPEAYTLQLASMADVKSLQKMIADKKIQGGKIIPQKIDGKTSYVLVVGSHEQRTQANQSSIEIKNATGISPWIRRMRDISARLD